MDWYAYPLLILAGIAAGFVNMLAGNGSLITLPALLFLGLPANVANATNRVGVTLQNVVGTAGFYRQGKMDVRGALLLSIPTVVGSILGARIAVNIDEAVFRKVLAVAMLMMLVIMLVKPERWINGKVHAHSGRLSIVQVLVFFAIGVYGGFLQAGVGHFPAGSAGAGPGIRCGASQCRESGHCAGVDLRRTDRLPGQCADSCGCRGWCWASGT